MALSSIFIAFSTGCNDTDSSELLTNAETNLKNGNVDTAIIELKNLIDDDYSLKRTHYLLGKIYFDKGIFHLAAENFNLAIKNGDQTEKTFLLLSESLLHLNDHQELDNLYKNNTIQKVNVLSELLSIMSISHYRNQDIDQANKFLSEAKKINDSGLYFDLAYSYIMAHEEKFDIALDKLDGLSRTNSRNSDVWLLTAHINTILGNYEKATDSYSRALDIQPNNRFFKVFLAQSLINENKYENASVIVNELYKFAPSHAIINEMMAKIKYFEQKHDDAYSYAQSAVRLGSNNIGIYTILGITAFSRNDFESSYRYLKQVISLYPNDTYLHKLYITSMFKVGHIDEALLKINELDLSNEDYNNFATKMSIELSHIGRHSDAIKIANNADQDATLSSTLRISLLKLSNNDTNGIKQLKHILSLKPEQPEANIGLVYYHITNGNIQQGEEILDAWIKNDDESVFPLLLKGYLLLLDKKYDSAISFYNRVLDIDPSNVSARLSIAQVNSSQGNHDIAYQSTLSLAKEHPDEFTIAMFLYRYGILTNNSITVVNFYKDKLSSPPNDLKPRIILARMYANINEPRKGIDLLDAIPDIHQTVETMSLLTLFNYQLGNYRQALIHAKSALNFDKTDHVNYFRVIQLSELNENYSVGIKAASKAEELFPEKPYFSLMKASLHQLNNQPKIAQKVLNNLPESIKDTSLFLHIQSNIHQDNGKYNEAISTAIKRYNTNPNSIAAKDLVILYTLNKQYHQAIDFINERLKTNPDSEGALQLLLAQLQRKVDDINSIKTYQDILHNDPDNIIALNNIAWLYLGVDEITKACDAAKKAIAFAPDNPEVQDTFGYCLLKSGDFEASLEPLTSAYQNRKNKIIIALHYAESLIRNDDLVRAKRVLNSINPSETADIEYHRELYNLAAQKQL